MLLSSFFLAGLVLLGVALFVFKVVRSLFPVGLEPVTTSPDLTGLKQGTCSCRAGKASEVPGTDAGAGGCFCWTTDDWAAGG